MSLRIIFSFHLASMFGELNFMCTFCEAFIKKKTL